MPDFHLQHLVDQAKADDQGALGELLQIHQKRLFNTALRMVGNHDDAAEVTQEAMLKVIEHIGDFNGQSSVSTWMTRIAMNLSFSHLRKRRIRQTVSLDTDGSAGRSGSHPGFGGDQLTPLREQIANRREPQPDSRVQKDEMVTQLQSALDVLQDDLRAVLVLRDIDEMDYQQIADVLAIPVGTVKSRLFRARLALRQEIFKRSTPPNLSINKHRNTQADRQRRSSTALPREHSDG